MHFSKIYKQIDKIIFSHLFLLLFAMNAVLLHNSTNAIKIKCSNMDDYYFTNPGSECGRYYKCSPKGQNEMLECSHGQKFDFYQQSCSSSPGKCPEPNCNRRRNGIYQDTTHACMRSFTCFDNQVTSVDNCPTKHLHNGQRCVPQDQVTCVQSSYAEDRRCANRLVDGLYVSDNNRNEYIVCNSGEVSDIRNCPDGDAFDTTTQKCLPQHVTPDWGNELAIQNTASITEEELCSNKVNGPVSDPTSKNCSTYIMCKSGIYDGQRQCSNQAVFNGENCVPSPLHQCNQAIAKRHAIDQCQHRSNGFYAYPQHGCSSYARCNSGRTVEVGVCPGAQYFDAEFGKCINERNFERRRCIERGTDSTDCYGRTDGYYGAAKCDTYFYCHGGSKIEYKCFTGKVFNGKTCVPKSQHKCPKTEIDSFCKYRPDGYYKDSNDGCRAYSYCSNGQKITYLCEPGHIFDSRSRNCVRKEFLATSPCHSENVCHGKSDGYHIDLKSNCRNYNYCNNNEKITQFTCRDGKVFNGQKCVSPNDYACPSLFNHQQINCVPRNCLGRCDVDGFYTDLNSGCRDFHICTAGKSTKSSCQAGMRFNGDICTAEDQVTCPVVCTHKRIGDREKECPLIGYVAN